jgi:hypothetical protein
VTRKRKLPRSATKLGTLDDFLKDDGKLEEFQATAIKEVLAWEIAEAMKANNSSRNGLATRKDQPEPDRSVAPTMTASGLPSEGPIGVGPIFHLTANGD